MVSAAASQTIAAYEIGYQYKFGILAINRDGEEKIFYVTIDSPMFCNMMAAFRAMPESKGWGIYESWEVV